MRLYPPRESKYMKCSRLRHWEKACRSLSDKRVGEVNFTDTQHDDEFFLCELTELAVIPGDAEDWRKPKVTLNGQPAEIKVDKGTDVIITLPSLFYSLKLTPFVKQDNQAAIMGPYKQKLGYLGTFTVD